MNSDLNALISVINSMNPKQKQKIVNEIRAISSKKKRSERNKRYYQRHKDKILAKNKVKNKIYADFISKPTSSE